MPLDKAIRETLSKLSSQDFNIKHRTLQETRAANTGLWFIQDEKFKSWVVAEPAILWCTGIGELLHYRWLMFSGIWQDCISVGLEPLLTANALDRLL